MQRSHISGLDLNLLVVLDAVLTEKNVSKAARRIGTTQPSVSRSLAQLRKWFADPLFVRSRHGMSPTAGAEALQVELRSVLEQVDLLVRRRAQFSPEASTRTFHIATADYAQALVLPALMSQLCTSAPGVSLRVEPWSAARMVEALDAGRVDLTIAPSLAKPVPLKTRAMFSDDFVVIARRGHPLAARTLTARRFCSAPHVQISPDGRDGSIVDDVLADRGHERRIALRVPSFTIAPLVVASTDFLAVVPRRIAQAAKKQLPLVLLRLPLSVPSFTLSMFWHERASDDPSLSWLRERILEVCDTSTARPRRVARLDIEHRPRGSL